MSSEAPHTNTVQSTSPSTSTETTHLGFATKRRREIDCEMSDCHNSEEHQDNILHELKNEAEAAARREQDKARYSSFENLYCEREEEQFQEINPPERKRRLIEPSSLPDDSQPVPLASSQDPLITYSQDSNVESNPTNQKYTTAKDLNDCETSSLNSVQSEEAFVFRMDMEGRTSTQKPFELSQRDDEKENGRSWSSFSPSKHPLFSQPRTLTNRTWTEPEPESPLKHIQEHLWEKADTEDITHSQAKWAKPRSSPLKKRATQRQVIEVDEDSLAMLFTQDTEGFRVIAHRGRQVRSPLKDQSNLHTGTTGRSSAHKCLVEEDEDEEILLTQDSQGYMVIKHWKRSLKTAGHSFNDFLIR